ncbi:hypothetical protein [Streptomyces sp. NBC_01803]|uniref:hypothetical protein n=1 Tax=Streptomyces sp. NBC_01803 TaxID=2975946 RepID=UPI003FA3767B
MATTKVANPVMKLDGDEMTRVIRRFISDGLILPYLDVDPEYDDLGIEHRDVTDDQVTVDAAHAIREHGVGVTRATVSPDEARVEEFGPKRMYRSPNGTIRNIPGGVFSREPIIMSDVPRRHGPALADHRGLPRGARREPEERDRAYLTRPRRRVPGVPPRLQLGGVPGTASDNLPPGSLDVERTSDT